MNIKLEPHGQFQKAIQAVRPDGRLVYNYWRLIEVCQDLYGFTSEDATEWVEYNICGLACNGFDIRYARLPYGRRPAETTATGRARKRRTSKRKKVK
jgi:hypothetical protein